jgi:hypothetical protein
MLRQGLWRTPAVRYTNRPHTDLLDTDRVPGAAAASQGARSVRLCSHPDTGRRVRLGQDGGGPAAAVAAPRRDRACRICSSALVNWPGKTQPAENGCPNAWTPDAACRTPGAGTPRHCGHPRPPQGTGTLRQRPRWIAGSRTVHHPATVSDRNGTPMCGTGQHARLTARSGAWCSASICSGPDGSGLITLSASSIWSAPDGSRRIVWMIKRMIKCLRQRIVDKASNRVEPPDLESDVLSTG